MLLQVSPGYKRRGTPRSSLLLAGAKAALSPPKALRSCATQRTGVWYLLRCAARPRDSSEYVRGRHGAGLPARQGVVSDRGGLCAACPDVRNGAPNWGSERRARDT